MSLKYRLLAITLLLAMPLTVRTEQAVQELIPLAMKAADIAVRAAQRSARHIAELKAKGIAEVPPSAINLRPVELAGLGRFMLDDWGEIVIDRRFVTDDEMKTVKAIEAWIAHHFPSETKRKKPRPRQRADANGLPIFRGFEDDRYQQYDALIIRLTAEFNANKARASGATSAQAAKIPDLSPTLVKSHMIEESGGNGPRSIAAWAVDPLQVNVPGDWGPEKALVGLVKPRRRNEGTLENNVRAAIRYLARKGFSASARPAAERPKGFFDGWPKALQRYNGRRDRTDTDRYYSDEYASKILRRAANPEVFVPIEIKLAHFDRSSSRTLFGASSNLSVSIE